MPFVSKDLNMKVYLIVLATLLPLIAGAPNGERSSSLTTQVIVERHGYPFEEHFIQTADGYVLGVHRIPYSPNVDSPTPRPVAFLMHGLLCSSSDWVLLGPENSLAFILSDLGFDVWLGNARGNTYSRKHVTYSPLLWNFWAFDWHEIGLIDLPAMIDYVRFYTGVDQVRYFGHSQGTTSFLLLNTLNAKFKSRIRAAHLLAPVAYMDHMESPLAKVGGPLMGQPNVLIELFGNAEFLPNTKAMELLGSLVCQETSIVKEICSNVLFLIGGFDQENLNQTVVPDIMATTPAGASINQLYHYLQEYESGYFRQFDYGWLRNQISYGTGNPPNYELNNIDLPIFLYYGDNDYMAAVVDVHRLIKDLPDTTLKGSWRVPHPKWTHLNFLYGLNLWEQLYGALLDDVKNS